MTALTADKPRRSIGEVTPVKWKMAASTTIYKGSLVMINSSGLAVPAAIAASNKGVVGVALEYRKSEASGTYEIEVGEGLWEVTGTGLAEADIQSKVYAIDDDVVGIDGDTATNAAFAGILKRFDSATSGWVEIRAVISGTESPGT